MPTAFSELANAQYLTRELTILLAIFLTVYLMAGLRLRSAISLITWFITILTFMLTIFVNLNFVWFWFSLFVNTIALTASVVVFSIFRSKI